jgi:hypothetical protein
VLVRGNFYWANSVNTEPAPLRTSKSPSHQDDWRSAASSRVESISFSIEDEQYGVDIMAAREIKKLVPRFRNQTSPGKQKTDEMGSLTRR